MPMDIKIGDVVELKKQHACGCKEFEITRIGMDIKIKCTKCLRSIMLDRETVEKKIKKIRINCWQTYTLWGKIDTAFGYCN